MIKIKSYLAFIGMVLFCLPQLASAGWETIPGAATDIGIGGSNVCVAGVNPVEGGYDIYRLASRGWQPISGGAIAITVGSNGRVWVTNNQGGIFTYGNGQWQQLPGSARDIGVGGNNQLWVIGTDPVPGGYSINHWNGQNWDRVEGGAVRIAVDTFGNPWVVNQNGKIYRFVAGHWEHLPGLATDIAIGRDGSAWVLGSDQVPGGYSIYHWNSQDWERVDGGAVRIAVDGNGFPWVVNNNGNVFKYRPDFQIKSHRHHRSSHIKISKSFQINLD